ncbi:MAG: ABC transporter substrate-binding protein [Deinococcus sp.]|nr:ABC transporter substrate-binding protein [Deinococcus sp.]
MRIRLVLVAVLAVALALGMAQVQGDRPVRGGLFRNTNTEAPASLDPAAIFDTASSFVQNAIYEGLYAFNPHTSALELRAAADFPTVSADNLVYTIPIRSGVFFHDDPAFSGGVGREVVCADAKYSLERILDADVIAIANVSPEFLFGAPYIIAGANEFNAGEADEISGIQCLDDHTLQITLTEPFAPFLNVLATNTSNLVPHEALEAYGLDGFQLHPVGTGPFYMESFVDGQEYVMKRFDRYWRTDEFGTQLPYLDGYRVDIVQDDFVAFLRFDLGEFDRTEPPNELYTELLTPRGADGRRRLQGRYAQDYILVDNPALDLRWFYFTQDDDIREEGQPTGERFTKFLTNQRLVRLALNYAVDRQGIVDSVLNGNGAPATSWINPVMPGFSVDEVGVAFTYDPERARQLLAEAGFPNGEGLPTFSFMTNDSGPNIDIATAVQAQFAEVGINMEITATPTFREFLRIRRGNNPPDIFRAGWSYDYPDPQNLYTNFYGPFIPNGDDGRYRNERFDELYRQALRTPRAEDRIPIYQEMNRIMNEDPPGLLLITSEEFRMNQPWVRNFPINGQTQIEDLATVWFADGGNH